MIIWQWLKSVLVHSKNTISFTALPSNSELNCFPVQLIEREQINSWLILEPFNTISILRTPPNPLLKCISTTQNINKQHPFEIHQSICQCEAAIPNQQPPLPADWLTFQWFWQMSKRTKKREAHSTIYISVYIQTRTSAPPLRPLIFFSLNSWKNKELLLQRKPWQKLLPKSTSHFYVTR